jgi:hypothetical protein
MFSNVLKNIFYKMQSCKVNKNRLIPLRAAIIAVFLIASSQNADAQNKHLIRVNMNECSNCYTNLYNVLRNWQNEQISILVEGKYQIEPNYVKEKLYLEKFGNITIVYNDSLISQIKVSEASEIFECTNNKYSRISTLAAYKIAAVNNEIDTTRLKAIFDANIKFSIPRLLNRKYCYVQNLSTDNHLNLVRKSDNKSISILQFDSSTVAKIYNVLLKGLPKEVFESHYDFLAKYPNQKPHVRDGDLLNDSIAIYSITARTLEPVDSENVDVVGKDLIAIKYLNYKDSIVIHLAEYPLKNSGYTRPFFMVHNDKLIYELINNTDSKIATSCKLDKRGVSDWNILPYKYSKHYNEELKSGIFNVQISDGNIFAYQYGTEIYELNTMKTIPIPFRKEIMQDVENIGNDFTNKSKARGILEIRSVFHLNDTYSVIYNYKALTYIIKFTEKKLISNTRLELPIKENMSVVSALQLTNNLMVYYAAPYGGYHFYELKDDK